MKRQPWCQRCQSRAHHPRKCPSRPKLGGQEPCSVCKGLGQLLYPGFLDHDICHSCRGDGVKWGRVPAVHMNDTAHLMLISAEETGEVSREIFKSLRFGLDDKVTRNPRGPRGKRGPTNREKLVNELNDFMGTVRLLVEAGVIPKDWASEEKQLKKMQKVRAFMAYSRKVGTLPANESPTNP